MNIENIYECYINSTECVDEENRRLIFEMDWLMPRLKTEEFLKLEQMISTFTIQNEKEMFKNGFQTAWDIFQSCTER